MKHSASYDATQFLFLLSLILLGLLAPNAQSQCPGNAASVTPRFVRHTLIIIPVKINGEGPFDFIVDTGSQITIIDPALATQLKLNLEGTIGFATVGSRVLAPTAELQTMEADSHIIEKPLVVIQDLRQLQSADPHIRGTLGENFLSHFDLFIDYTHKLLCLDETKQLQQAMRGEHILLVAAQDPEGELPLAPRLTIAVHLSNAKERRLLLRIDSGTNSPILFAGRQDTPQWMRKRLSQQASIVGSAQQAFDLLPPQDLRIGNRTLRQVTFATPVRTGSTDPKNEQDGLLPTALFQRVFISFADHFVVFDPE